MRSTCLIIGSALLLLIAVPVACGGGSIGPSGSSSTSGTTGSGGGGIKCATSEDCPGGDTLCAVRTCEDQVCGRKILMAGMPLPAQTYGDCKVAKCDSIGNLDKAAPDDTDVYDDGNPCTVDTCDKGVPSNLPNMMAMCGDMTAPGVCNASGACAECIDDTQCTANATKPKCTTAGKCVPDTCLDKMKTGDETDVDCGGKTCVPLMGLCISGQHCKAASDCESRVCKSGTCAAAICTDGVKNGDETDVDCGGACPACEKQ